MSGPIHTRQVSTTVSNMMIMLLTNVHCHLTYVIIMVFNGRFFTWWKETAYCGRKTPLEQGGQVFEETFLEIYHWALLNDEERPVNKSSNGSANNDNS